MRNLLLLGLSATALVSVGTAVAAQEPVGVTMNLISDQGVGKEIGTISLSDSQNGFLVLKLDLAADLPPGGHGFHVHQNPSCDAAEKDGKMTAGLAAGGHYDPGNTGKHLGPSGDGHLGDLPILYVGIDEDGTTESKHSLVAPRLKVADVRGRSLMVHQNSDNFRDDPKPLGGGGARIACGVIP
jgi:Cu-Zn family superoxide dismutase